MTKDEMLLEALYDQTYQIEDQIQELEEKKKTIMEQVFVLYKHLQEKGI